MEFFKSFREKLSSLQFIMGEKIFQKTVVAPVNKVENPVESFYPAGIGVGDFGNAGTIFRIFHEKLDFMLLVRRADGLHIPDIVHIHGQNIVKVGEILPGKLSRPYIIKVNTVFSGGLPGPFVGKLPNVISAGSGGVDENILKVAVTNAILAQFMAQYALCRGGATDISQTYKQDFNHFTLQFSLCYYLYGYYIYPKNR